MKSLFVLIVGLYLSSFSLKSDIKSVQSIPVQIKYIDPQPPDSISQFLTTYLKIKKVNVVTKNADVNDIFRERGSQVEAAIREYAEQPGSMNFSDKIIPMIEKPFSYTLFIKGFPDTSVTNIYKFDSIQWEIKPIPYKDSTHRFITYKTEKKLTDPFDYLKGFVEHIVKKDKLLH